MGLSKRLTSTSQNEKFCVLLTLISGITTHVGIGHSAVVTAISFSPNNRYIVSTSASGSIFVWHNPMYKQAQEAAPPTTEEDKQLTPREVKALPTKSEKPQDENVADLPTSRSAASSRNGSTHSKSSKVHEVSSCTCADKTNCTCQPNSLAK